MKTVFIRVLEELEDKERALRAALAQPAHSANRQLFEVDPVSFNAVPGSPFAYWVGDDLRNLFKKLPAFETKNRTARMGLTTNSDFRFLRLFWETQANSPKVLSFAKGGAYSPIYADTYLQLRWMEDGHELKAFALSTPGTTHWSRNIRSPDFYGRPGITWPRRTKSQLSFRALPRGCAFADKGPAAFVAGDEIADLLAILAIGTSRPFAALVEFQLAAADARRGGAAHSYEVGVIQSTPVPDLSAGDLATLAPLVRRAWSLKRSLDTCMETSHAFLLPAILQVEGDSLAARAAVWNSRRREIEAELGTIRAEIDERCFTLYGIDDEDRRAITEGFGASSTGSETSEDGEEEEDAEDEADPGADTSALAAELVSWAVGVAFGRFDVRLATGDRPLPSEPEPFDRLPVSSAGMLTRDDGLPLARPPAGYPLSFSEDGILVDDPGHPRDLATAVRAVFEMVFGPRADAMWQEVAALLDPRDYDLRRWLASAFFEHHLRRHSKSRRKAPILWQFGTPSGRYNIWCYAHRMTRDSLFAIQNDIVGPKLATEERRLSSLVTQAGQTPSARERAEIAAQQAFVDELRAFADEVRRVAPLWNPDLDDGIVLVIAPIWRLVPTHKAWQKELRTKWDELVVGKYDWAHGAMHLWPERVLPKCANDRSLAIAHRLEDVFWVESEEGKWAARKAPAQPFAELIRDRTSPAVRAALVSLVDSPSPIGGGKRSKNSRKTF